MTHTPGPWTWVGDKDGWEGIRADAAAHGLVLWANGMHTPGWVNVENEADRTLIACAPRLLAALIDLDDLLSFDSPVEAGRENGWNFSDTTLINAAIAEARAAIKEAEGS